MVGGAAAAARAVKLEAARLESRLGSEDVCPPGAPAQPDHRMVLAQQQPPGAGAGSGGRPGPYRRAEGRRVPARSTGDSLGRTAPRARAVSTPAERAAPK